MNNTSLFRISIGAAVLVLVLVVAALSMRQSQGTLSVVYMTTGEVYVGKLSTFPRLTLSDGYLFQTGVDPQDPDKVASQLVQLSDAVWAPSVFYLNRDQVVFSGPVSESSQLFEALRAGNTSASQ